MKLRVKLKFAKALKVTSSVYSDVLGVFNCVICLKNAFGIYEF